MCRAYPLYVHIILINNQIIEQVTNPPAFGIIWFVGMEMLCFDVLKTKVLEVGKDKQMSIMNEAVHIRMISLKCVVLHTQSALLTKVYFLTF